MSIHICPVCGEVGAPGNVPCTGKRHGELAPVAGSPDTIEDYRNAMVSARRDRDDLASTLNQHQGDAHDWLETVAKALGIQTGRESWWESSDAEQRAKVLHRIKRLRANTEVNDLGSEASKPKARGA